MKHTDTELLDWLEQQHSQNSYSPTCIFRQSATGKGWRLHSISEFEAESIQAGILSFTVRQAVINAIETERKDVQVNEL